ncbi:MAG: glycerol-3-phosphate 1-O-acyltransferase PlsY [Candidatus Omnitrophota bacterium]
MVLLGILISYLTGSFPSAYILGRFFKGIDIRKHGSGNVGATNAFRVLGPVNGVIVLVLDILKGIIPVTLLADYFLGFWNFSPLILRIILGLACVCGHNWTLFLRFKGGKGVATTLGVLAGLGIAIVELRTVLLLTVAAWLLVFLVFRIVSLASVISAVVFPLFVFILQASKELLIFSLILSIFIIIRHKKNLLGLMHKN